MRIVFEMEDGHPVPEYETPGAAGMDLRAYLPVDGIVIGAGERALVSVGFRIQLPEKYEMQIRPRSGMALKHGITILNVPGTIDSDYRGTVGVILYNTSRVPFGVSHGDRIAQGVIAKVEIPDYVMVGKIITDTGRNGGFGSTGVK